MILLLAIGCMLIACHQPQTVRSFTTEAMAIDESGDAIQDTDYLNQLAPIKEDLEREMNVQIGYVTEAVWGVGTECTMLNWAREGSREAATQVDDGRVDIAIVNIGGMRCSWPAGAITRGMLFELMRCDNRWVVLTVRGEDVLALCESVVLYGCQGGACMRVTIIDGQVADVQINGKALDPKAQYTVATSDYLSGGADHMDALANYVDLWNSDLLIRDLYLQAVRDQDTIRVAVDGRMTIEP